MLAAAVLAAGAACGKKETLQSSLTEGSAGGSGASGPAASGSSSKGTPMASSQTDIALVQQTIAQGLKLAPADIRVEIVDAKALGVTVFTATADPGKAGREISRSGAVDGGTIYVEAEAMSRVARAWGYGTQRTVPAETVAKVFGLLHSSTHETSALVGDRMLRVFKQTAHPKQAAAAEAPKETDIDGRPAVSYCITSSERSIPFTVVTAVVGPDFRVELRTQSILRN
jgi:hypothetical protein